MSLLSYLNMDTGSSTSSATGTQMAQALKTIADKKATRAGANGGSGTSSVSITVEAKRASAEKADAARTPAELTSAVRKSLDKQYVQNGRDSGDLRDMSGRALATIILNEDGKFSKGEIAAAKQELRARDRQLAIGVIGSGTLTSASLATYLSETLAARSQMSAEEQRLREINPQLR